MQTTLRLPENFVLKEFDPNPFSNFEGDAESPALETLKNSDSYALYSAWDFNGKLWWSDKFGYWCMEIWKNHSYTTTHIMENYADLIDEVKQTHGAR